MRQVDNLPRLSSTLQADNVTGKAHLVFCFGLCLVDNAVCLGIGNVLQIRLGSLMSDVTGIKLTRS